MPEQGLLDVLRRSGGLVAIARQIDITPPEALAAAGALLPLVRGGFRRRVEAAPALDQGILALLAWLEQLGGGALASNVLQGDDQNGAAGQNILAGIFAAEQVPAVVAEAARLSEISAETVARVLPLLAMLAGGYVWARAGRLSGGEQLAELGQLLDLAGEPNPLDALTGIADQQA